MIDRETACFDAWIRKQAANLGLAEGFTARLRKAHGFVPSRAIEHAQAWAETVSAALFFAALVPVEPGWRALLSQMQERAGKLAVAAEYEAGRGALE